MRVLLAAVVIVLMVHSRVSDAALISQDWNVHGDNGITLDTETGYQWLDLTYSFNMSAESVVAELDGGIFADFRLPTFFEALALRQHAGITLSMNQLPSVDPVQVEAVRMFQVLLTNMESTSIFDHPYTDMGAMGIDMDDGVSAGYKHFRFFPAGTWREVPSVGLWSVVQAADAAEPWIGTLLIAVPEPATLSLLAFGGLALIRRRK